MRGVEPLLIAYETTVLPLNYIGKIVLLRKIEISALPLSYVGLRFRDAVFRLALDTILSKKYNNGAG